MAVFAWIRAVWSGVGSVAQSLVGDDMRGAEGASPMVVEHHVHIVVSDEQIRSAVRAELGPMIEKTIKAMRAGKG